MPSIFITGSNRGLGLEWVRQYVALGWKVYASCRYPEQADELRQLAQMHSTLSIPRLDVTNAEQIAEVAESLVDETIDVLINNAGVYLEKFGQDKLGQISYPDWRETLGVNTLGAMRVSEALSDQVARSDKKLIVTITSHMGSIAEIESPGSYAYRSSKAALNTAMKGLSLELMPRHVGVLLLHPGWVKTRMGGPGALITTETSVKGMRRIVEGFEPSHSGRFFRYDGNEIPW